MPTGFVVDALEWCAESALNYQSPVLELQSAAGARLEHPISLMPPYLMCEWTL